ncbi:MAG: glutamate--tRNA ligase [Francisellaceae bacterium]
MIRTRFAPSPTGYLHVGGARTALFSWLYARKHKGEFLLRVEDTDLERSTEEAVAAILDGMGWLKMHSDRPPVFQTQRFERYKEKIDELLSSGKAYCCYCSKERLDTLRQSQLEAKNKPRYDGKCRHLPEDREQQDQPHVIRFKNPQTGIVSWNDAIKGEIRFANEELDDFIICRSDGTPTYNFCVVVDDIDMEITHVTRGDDHVNNTPRQINLYHAFNAKVPVFAHIPMILGDDGQKLSKRHGAVSVMQYRDEGYIPEALINYLVRLGWSHGDQEVFTIDEMIAYFDLSDVNASASAFNTEKLNWLNQHYMRHLPAETVADYLRWHFNDQELDESKGPPLTELIAVMAEKAKTLKELARLSSCFYREFDEFDENQIKKHFKAQALAPLRLALARFEQLDKSGWQDAEMLHQILTETAAELELGMGKVGMPVRVAITGSGQSPDIGITLKWVGRTRTLARLERAIAEIEKRIQQSA